MGTGTQNGDHVSNRYLLAQRAIVANSRSTVSFETLRSQVAQPLSKPPIFDLLAVIDNRALERECFVLCLQQQCQGVQVIGFESVSAWREYVGESDIKQIILKNIGSKLLTDESVKSDMKRLVSEAGSVPVVDLGASDDVDTVVAALECGAVGYIPPCIHFQHIVEATSLAMSGGVFLSRQSLFAMRDTVSSTAPQETTVLLQFTARQLAVARVLRRGAANKTIAYALNLRESTVKVHVRQIFKKLTATNRTQAAFLLNQMSGWPADETEVG
jgi:DNA-binding NarL/FixJ family response regulator